MTKNEQMTAYCYLLLDVMFGCRYMDKHCWFRSLKVCLLVGCIVCMLSSFATTGEVSRVTVRTRAKSNPNPSIWYRVPCDYRKVPGFASLSNGTVFTLGKQYGTILGI